MGAIKDRAKEILAADIASRRGIPLEAADDFVEQVQSVIYDYFADNNTGYDSLEEIFDDYGIPRYLQWVFDVGPDIL